MIKINGFPKKEMNLEEKTKRIKVIDKAIESIYKYEDQEFICEINTRLSKGEKNGSQYTRE